MQTSLLYYTQTVSVVTSIAPKGLRAGDAIQSGVDAPIKAGNALPMRNMPVGSTVHNVELKPGKGAQIARSAGAYVTILARDGAVRNITSSFRRNA